MAADRWSVYDPGRDGPEFRSRSDYGYDRVAGRRPGPALPRPSTRERDLWSRTRDEVQAWFGDRGAEDRRRRDARLAGHQHELIGWRDEDDIVWGAERHAERATFRGRGPRGYRRPDSRIGEDVADRLTDDPFLDATDIQVHVLDGEVTLSGLVDSQEARSRAERLAERVSGACRVWNRLDIRGR